MCKSMSSESDVDSRNSSSHNISALSVGSVSPITGLDVHRTLGAMSLEEQMDTIDEKLKRTSKFLQEIQALSPVCEEPLHEDIKEKQVFIRRILQVSAELQDARDAIHQICQPPRLTQRQCDLILTTNNDSYLDDPSHDPSVRFFGVEWEQIFNKCFSLTLNLQIFRTQVLNSVPLDLVLLNSILKDLARVEVDVTSHGEAVLHGRLSKSQQQLIKQEQSRLNSMVPPPQPKVSKSRSFRDSSISGSQRRQRQISKYKKNKTTDLHKLQDQSSQPTTVTTTNANDNMVGPTINIIDNNNEKSTGSIEDEWQQVMRDASSTRRKSSFIQNVSSIFKNIR